MWKWFKNLFVSRRCDREEKELLKKIMCQFAELDLRTTRLKLANADFDKRHEAWHEKHESYVRVDQEMRRINHEEAMRHYRGETGAFYQEAAAKIACALISGVGTKSAQSATTKKAIVKTAFDYADLMFAEKQRRVF